MVTEAQSRSAVDRARTSAASPASPAVGCCLAVPGCVAWLAFELVRRPGSKPAGDGQAAVAAAQKQALAIMTLNYKTAKADLQRVIDGSTGTMKTQYAKSEAGTARERDERQVGVDGNGLLGRALVSRRASPRSPAPRPRCSSSVTRPWRSRRRRPTAASKVQVHYRFVFEMQKSGRDLEVGSAELRRSPVVLAGGVMSTITKAPETGRHRRRTSPRSQPRPTKARQKPVSSRRQRRRGAAGRARAPARPMLRARRRLLIVVAVTVASAVVAFFVHRSNSDTRALRRWSRRARTPSPRRCRTCRRSSATTTAISAPTSRARRRSSTGQFLQRLLRHRTEGARVSPVGQGDRDGDRRRSVRRAGPDPTG